MKKLLTLALAGLITFGAAYTLSSCEFINSLLENPFVQEEEFPDLNEEFYKASNWKYMTNNGGASNDGGGIPYSLDDGSIKFHNANQAYLLENDLSNDSASFMIKTSKDWQMWFRGSSMDNTKNDCYKLFFKDEVLHIRTSESANDIALVSAKDCGYKTNEWNTITLSFSTDENKNCAISLTVNEDMVTFSAPATGENYVQNGKLVYPEKDTFTPGKYVMVKVWYGDCYLQLKPLACHKEKDVLRVACIGDSITYGSNAGNAYTESYPAQLQQLYGGEANVMNFGNSGKTIRDTADDPYSKTTEYNGAMLFVPDVTIIMLGTNDSKTYQVPTQTEMFNAYVKLIDALYECNPSMEIYMATAPVAYNGNFSINNNNIEKIVIPAQREAADEYGLYVIEMHEYTRNLSGCYGDGIHPNTRGYTYVAYMMHCELNGITPDEEYVASFKD